jgi:hypothetical protein
LSRSVSLVLTLLAVTLVLSATASSRPVADSKELATDTSGDSGNAPDLTAGSISNNNEGKLTWRIGIGNRAQFAAPDIFFIYMDADGTDTGPDGFEFLLQHDPEQGPALFKWNGTEWADTQSKSLAVSFTSGALELSLDFRELDSQSLLFWFESDTLPITDDKQFDLAPNGDGVHFYFVDVPLLFGSFTKPARVTAGRTATLSLNVWTDGDRRGSVGCTGRVGSKQIRGSGSWASVTITVPSGGQLVPIAYKGTVTCRFKIPRSAKRKPVSLRISATKSGATVFRTFAGRAR